MSGSRSLMDCFTDLIRFVAPSHTQTMMGKALHASCVSSRVNDRFQESLYLFLELLRAGVVHGVRWSGQDTEPLSGGPSFGSEEDQSSTLLVMRVLSILPLNFRVGRSSYINLLTIAEQPLVGATMGRSVIKRITGFQFVRSSPH